MGYYQSHHQGIETRELASTPAESMSTNRTIKELKRTWTGLERKRFLPTNRTIKELKL